VTRSRALTVPAAPLPAVVWPLLLAFGALCWPTARAYRMLDDDLAWQHRLGDAILATHALPRALDARAFTAPGAPWVPQEWAFSLAVAAAANAHAWAALALAVTGCALAALALSAYRGVVRGAEPFAVALTTGFAAVVLKGTFGVRDQVVAWLPFSLVLLLAEDERLVWWCVPVVALWANLHASVLIAPVVLGAAAAGAALDDGGFSARARTRTLVALASLAALGASPLGFALVPYALALQGGIVRRHLIEWALPLFVDGRVCFGVLPLVAAVAARGFGPPRHARDPLWFGLFLVAGLDAVRHLPLLALAVAPQAASALTPPRLVRTGPALARVRTRGSLAVGALLLAACVAAVVPAGNAVAARLPPPPAIVPSARLVAAVAALPGTRRVYCDGIGACSTVLDAPNATVYMDGREDPYPPAVWREMERLIALAPDWQAILARRRIDTLVLENDSPLAQSVGTTGAWREVLGDERFHLWARRAAPAARR
jgi:hypothetical protein